MIQSNNENMEKFFATTIHVPPFIGEIYKEFFDKIVIYCINDKIKLDETAVSFFAGLSEPDYSLFESVLDTPRKVKLFANLWISKSNHYGNKVNTEDLFYLSMIQVTSPATYELILRNKDLIVDPKTKSPYWKHWGNRIDYRRELLSYTPSQLETPNDAIDFLDKKGIPHNQLNLLTELGNLGAEIKDILIKLLNMSLTSFDLYYEKRFCHEYFFSKYLGRTPRDLDDGSTNLNKLSEILTKNPEDVEGVTTTLESVYKYADEHNEGELLLQYLIDSIITTSNDHFDYGTTMLIACGVFIKKLHVPMTNIRFAPCVFGELFKKNGTELTEKKLAYFSKVLEHKDKISDTFIYSIFDILNMAKAIATDSIIIKINNIYLTLEQYFGQHYLQDKHDVFEPEESDEPAALFGTWNLLNSEECKMYIRNLLVRIPERVHNICNLLYAQDGSPINTVLSPIELKELFTMHPELIEVAKTNQHSNNVLNFVLNDN